MATEPNEIDQLPGPGMRVAMQITELFKKAIHIYGLVFVCSVMWSILGEFWKDAEQYFLLFILCQLSIASAALALAALLVFWKVSSPETNKYIDKIIRVSSKQFLVNYGFCLVMFGISTVIFGQGTGQEYINFCLLLIPEAVVLAYIKIKRVRPPLQINETDPNLEDIVLSFLRCFMRNLLCAIVLGVIGSTCAVLIFRDEKLWRTHIKLINLRIFSVVMISLTIFLGGLCASNQSLRRAPEIVRKEEKNLSVMYV